MVELQANLVKPLFSAHTRAGKDKFHSLTMSCLYFTVPQNLYFTVAQNSYKLRASAYS